MNKNIFVADSLETAAWTYIASLYGEANIAGITEERMNVMYVELSAKNLRLICTKVEEVVADVSWAYTFETYLIA